MINDYSTVRVSDGVTAVEFEVIAETGEYDYSWWVTAVIRRKTDGALFLVNDGGCSCYGFGEDLTVADLKPVESFEAALRHKDVSADTRAGLQRSYAANGASEQVR